MGFGLLLIGYFMANILPVISFLSVAMPVGYALMALALFRLAPYQRRYLYAFAAALATIPVTLYYAVYGIVTLTGGGAGLFSPAVFAVFEWIYFALSLIFTALLLLSEAALSRELSLYREESNAWRNLIFLLLYHLLYLVVQVLDACGVPHMSAFVIPMTMLRYLCIFLNVWLFFKAYRYIVPEGSEIAPPAQSTKRKGGTR